MKYRLVDAKHQKGGGALDPNAHNLNKPYEDFLFELPELCDNLVKPESGVINSYKTADTNKYTSEQLDTIRVNNQKHINKVNIPASINKVSVDTCRVFSIIRDNLHKINQNLYEDQMDRAMEHKRVIEGAKTRLVEESKKGEDE